MADTHFALFFNHGQCCAAGSRVYVHEKIYDDFVAKAAQAAKDRWAAAAAVRLAGRGGCCVCQQVRVHCALCTVHCALCA